MLDGGQSGQGVAPSRVYPGNWPQDEGAHGHAGMGQCEFGAVDYRLSYGNEVDVDGAVSVRAVGAAVRRGIDGMLYLLQQAV